MGVWGECARKSIERGNTGDFHFSAGGGKALLLSLKERSGIPWGYASSSTIVLVIASQSTMQ